MFPTNFETHIPKKKSVYHISEIQDINEEEGNDATVAVYDDEDGGRKRRRRRSKSSCSI